MPEPFSGPPSLHPSLGRHTGFLISRLGVIATRRFAARLEKLQLTPRMWGAMNVLDAEGPITQHALGRAIGMDPSTMVATLDELEARGLVERRPHPSDRRAHALYMTDEGRRTLRRGRELAKQAHNELLAPLNPDERKQLHDLLLRVMQSAAGLDDAPPVTDAEARAMARRSKT
jgi:MarR family transcriptional regulator, lower aerobic nicotinate degradation pathway regulator